MSDAWPSPSRLTSTRAFCAEGLHFTISPFHLLPSPDMKNPVIKVHTTVTLTSLRKTSEFHYGNLSSGCNVTEHMLLMIHIVRYYQHLANNTFAWFLIHVTWARKCTKKIGEHTFNFAPSLPFPPQSIATHDTLMSCCVCVCTFLAIQPELADTEYVITVLRTSVSNPQSLVWKSGSDGRVSWSQSHI